MSTQTAYPTKEGMLVFWCPGCECAHQVQVIPTPEFPKPWTWNNDKINPSIDPSVLTQSRTLTESGLRQHDAWMEGGPKPDQFDSVETRCHLFVRNGFIEYLPDCTHKLAGKTVKMGSL